MKETKDKILLKALQFLVLHDYETVSLNSIAEGIGITKGGIYHYFSSKDELFKECLEIIFKHMQNVPLGTLTVQPKLEEVLGSLFSFDTYMAKFEEIVGIDFDGNYLNFSYLLFMGLKKFPEIKEMVSEIYRGTRMELEGLFISLQDRGEISREINCQYLAFELVALAEGVMLISEFSKEVDLAKISNDIVQSTLRRIRT